MTIDLAPEIFRQKLLIEGIYEREIGKTEVKDYFRILLSELSMTSAGKQIVNSSLGMGKKENQGIEAFQPLIESGISLYTWETSKFISVIIFTCKPFDKNKAIAITSNYFKLTSMVSESF